VGQIKLPKWTKKTCQTQLRDRAIVLLLLRLGLRAGDIVSMRPSDIDWQDGTLLVVSGL
jgi:integrase